MVTLETSVLSLSLRLSVSRDACLVDEPFSSVKRSGREPMALQNLWVPVTGNLFFFLSSVGSRRLMTQCVDMKGNYYFRFVCIDLYLFFVLFKEMGPLENILLAQYMTKWSCGVF